MHYSTPNGKSKSNTKVGEWGRKARKREARIYRVTDRRDAIRYATEND
jgi:hypothetical protein